MLSGSQKINIFDNYTGREPRQRHKCNLVSPIIQNQSPAAQPLAAGSLLLIKDHQLTCTRVNSILSFPELGRLTPIPN